MALPQPSLPPLCSQPLRLEFRRSQRNVADHGLTPLQIRFEPQRAQRTFGRVGRTLSGLSARGGVSRAVGAGELNCSANHGLTLMDTDRKSGGYGENFNVQYQISNIQFPSEQPKTKRLEVGRTLSGLSARGGVSRAGGTGDFNIQHSTFNIQYSSRLDRDASPYLSTCSLPGVAVHFVGRGSAPGGIAPAAQGWPTTACQRRLARPFDPRRSISGHQPSTTNHQPSTIHHQPSTIHHQPTTNDHCPQPISIAHPTDDGGIMP